METRCLTQGQMLEAELDLMEFTDGQYSHLQRVIPANMEAGTGPDVSLMSRCWPDVRDHPAAVMVTDVTGPTVTSPLATTQAIDLSVAPEDHSLVKPGRRPHPLLWRSRGLCWPDSEGKRVRLKCPSTAARPHRSQVRDFPQEFAWRRGSTQCLLTSRDRGMFSQQLSASSFVKIFQQPGNAQNTLCPHMQTWMKTEGASLLGVSSPANAGGVFNPVSTMCAQVVDNFPHMDELNKHQDDVVTPAVSRKWGHSTRQRARPGMSLIQSRERHNSIERERRKMIRLYCDELNMLVPFCQSGTDRVTTLQWTTAFLVYINKMYGDTFKKEFQNHSMTRKNCV